MAAALFITLETVQNLLGRSGEIGRQPKMTSKAQQKRAIVGTQHFVKKTLKIGSMLLRKMVLTATGVDQQAELQGHLRTQLEIGNFLRDSVFQDFKVVLTQTGHQRAAFVTHGGGNGNQLHLHSNGRLREADRKLSEK